ncbi:MAG: UDP-N-acetylmuramoyl-L-alanine--D-glutamate ligase, partial [Acidimicrobiia bacterium]|nr:UDP-N-acetylmuramoyl-L-alanine--D-glutamate ligase [Acidimicrobiia bacterium]
MTVLVHGLAVAGAATVRALLRRGVEVIASDDMWTPARADLAADLGVELVVTNPHDDGGDAALNRLVASCEYVVPAPGVPETHCLFAVAAAEDKPVCSEIELAYRWEAARVGGPRPMLAVTGTDGKTTTTMMAVAILAAAGVRSVAAGNTDVPLVDAIDDDLDAFVVECSSFRLAWADTFRAEGAAWLNLAPDHLNWHAGTTSYEAAKARIFDQQRPSDVAVGFADDPVVMARLVSAPGRKRTFALRDADYRVEGDGPAARLVGPDGSLADVAAMARSLPHDLTNGLAAAALTIETGLADPAAVAGGLAAFVGPPHRIELVGEADGIRWFNDSKATTPHAASVAIRAFERVVLIAGGSSKGLDLRAMAAEPRRVRAVVAIGAAAPSIAAVFAGLAPVSTAASMSDAVDRAGDLAVDGDVVLLSPGCASFDWYPDGGYPARG